MDKKRVGQIKEQFDLVIHSDETAKIEFWYARDLMSLLGYERWENFDKAIGRAMESCKTSGIEVSDHFREVTKTISKQTSKQFNKLRKKAVVRFFRTAAFNIL